MFTLSLALKKKIGIRFRMNFILQQRKLISIAPKPRGVYIGNSKIVMTNVILLIDESILVTHALF